MSQKIRCIAVDDEAPGLSVIKMYCSKLPTLELLETFQNPVEALAYIEEQQPDLVFLDINMPDINGLQFVSLLKQQPAIIFTTAHKEFAVESYDVQAVDYLLKPIVFDRFEQAVQKAQGLISQPVEQEQVNNDPHPDTSAHPGFIFLKSDTRFIKVNLKDIQFIEGMRDYVKVHTIDQHIMTLSGMEKMLQRLPEKDFIRVHRSFIVGVHHIDMVQHNHVMIGEEKISVSNTYREALFNLIEEHSKGA